MNYLLLQVLMHLPIMIFCPWLLATEEKRCCHCGGTGHLSKDCKWRAQ